MNDKEKTLVFDIENLTFSVSGFSSEFKNPELKRELVNLLYRWDKDYKLRFKRITFRLIFHDLRTPNTNQPAYFDGSEYLTIFNQSEKFIAFSKEIRNLLRPETEKTPDGKKIKYQSKVINTDSFWNIENFLDQWSTLYNDNVLNKKPIIDPFLESFGDEKLTRDIYLSKAEKKQAKEMIDIFRKILTNRQIIEFMGSPVYNSGLLVSSRNHIPKVYEQFQSNINERISSYVNANTTVNLTKLCNNRAINITVNGNLGSSVPDAVFVFTSKIASPYSFSRIPSLQFIKCFDANTASYQWCSSDYLSKFTSFGNELYNQITSNEEVKFWFKGDSSDTITPITNIKKEWKELKLKTDSTVSPLKKTVILLNFITYHTIKIQNEKFLLPMLKNLRIFIERCASKFSLSDINSQGVYQSKNYFETFDKTHLTDHLKEISNLAARIKSYLSNFWNCCGDQSTSNNVNNSDSIRYPEIYVFYYTSLDTRKIISEEYALIQKRQEDFMVKKQTAIGFLASTVKNIGKVFLSVTSYVGRNIIYRGFNPQNITSIPSIVSFFAKTANFVKILPSISPTIFGKFSSNLGLSVFLASLETIFQCLVLKFGQYAVRRTISASKKAIKYISYITNPASLVFTATALIFRQSIDKSLVQKLKSQLQVRPESFLNEFGYAIEAETAKIGKKSSQILDLLVKISSNQTTSAILTKNIDVLLNILDDSSIYTKIFKNLQDFIQQKLTEIPDDAKSNELFQKFVQFVYVDLNDLTYKYILTEKNLEGVIDQNVFKTKELTKDELTELVLSNIIEPEINNLKSKISDILKPDVVSSNDKFDLFDNQITILFEKFKNAFFSRPLEWTTTKIRDIFKSFFLKEAKSGAFVTNLKNLKSTLFLTQGKNQPSQFGGALLEAMTNKLISQTPFIKDDLERKTFDDNLIENLKSVYNKKINTQTFYNFNAEKYAKYCSDIYDALQFNSTFETYSSLKDKYQLDKYILFYPDLPNANSKEPNFQKIAFVSRFVIEIVFDTEIIGEESRLDHYSFTEVATQKFKDVLLFFTGRLDSGSKITLQSSKSLEFLSIVNDPESFDKGIIGDVKSIVFDEKNVAASEMRKILLEYIKETYNNLKDTSKFQLKKFYDKVNETISFLKHSAVGKIISDVIKKKWKRFRVRFNIPKTRIIADSFPGADFPREFNDYKFWIFFGAGILSFIWKCFKGLINYIAIERPLTNLLEKTLISKNITIANSWIIDTAANGLYIPVLGTRYPIVDHLKKEYDRIYNTLANPYYYGLGGNTLVFLWESIKINMFISETLLNWVFDYFKTPSNTLVAKSASNAFVNIFGTNFVSNFGYNLRIAYSCMQSLIATLGKNLITGTLNTLQLVGLQEMAFVLLGALVTYGVYASLKKWFAKKKMESQKNKYRGENSIFRNLTGADLKNIEFILNYDDSFFISFKESKFQLNY